MNLRGALRERPRTDGARSGRRDLRCEAMFRMATRWALSIRMAIQISDGQFGECMFQGLDQ